MRTESSDSGLGAHEGVFATTHWSVVLQAVEGQSPAAAAALEQLCRTYWYPLYAYVRRHGYSPEDAQDLTQGFFARLLARHSLKTVCREQGLFRCFMLATFKRFLINEREHAGAVKRGGSKVHVPFDGHDAEERYRLDAGEQNTPDKLFDRAWGLSILEATSRRLEEECRLEGKEKLCQRLSRFLPREHSDETYAAVGLELGLSEGAVKVAVHRLRRRYRELLREEVAQTVSSASGLEQELQNLKAVFYE